MPKKKENRGGARAGAGRPKGPPKQYSEKFKGGLWKALAKKAKDTGKTIYDVMADMLYDRKVQDAVRVSIFKAFKETMVIPESKTTSEAHKFEHGPGVMLPPVQEKPKEAFEKEKGFKMGLN